MADGTGGEAPPDLDRECGRHHTPAPQALAADWITIWQSELAALATDRELQDGWVRWVGLWAQAAQSAARFLPSGAATPETTDADAPGRAGPASQTRAAAPVVAPDARDAAIQRLADRVAELERQLQSTGGIPAPPRNG